MGCRYSKRVRLQQDMALLEQSGAQTAILELQGSLFFGTGGRTKYNRVRLGLPKAHYLDAACVGESGADVIAPGTLRPLSIKAMGHGRRLMCVTDAYGFRRRKANGAYCEPKSKQDGWRTGDLARATIPRGKYAGTHTGRIVVRRGSFKIDGIPTHRKYLTPLHRADGYDYS
jgi:hypothetical protein